MIPRDNKYLEFVRGLPCCVCGANARPHHVEMGGKSIKGSDGSCIPLCVDHHRELHTLGHRRMEEKHGFSVTMEMANTLHQYLFDAPIRFPGDLVRAVVT